MKAKDKPQMMLRMKPEIKAWVEKKASEQERSQTWLIGKILEQAMQSDDRAHA